MNAGDKPVFSNNGLVTTIGWGLNGEITYVLEGSVFVAGAAIQWLRDELHLVDSASDTEYLRERYRMQTAATSCLHLQDLELLTGISMPVARSWD